MISTLILSSGSLSNISFLVQTYKDILHWLFKNKEKFVFCFPTKSTSSDHLFFIRSKVIDRYLLVVAQVRN